MMMELKCLKKVLETRNCSCGSNKIDIFVTTMTGVKSFLNWRCVQCKHVEKFSTTTDKFNAAFWTAIVSNGISSTQAEEFFLDLNFSAVNEVGHTISVNFMSDFNVKLRHQMMNNIVAAGLKDQSYWLNIAKQSDSRCLTCMCDGCYPVRGFNSSCCITTLMLKLKDEGKKIVQTVVSKQDNSKEGEEEGQSVEAEVEPEEAEDSDAEDAELWEMVHAAEQEELNEEEQIAEHVIWGRCASQQLEATGFKAILKGAVKQLLANDKTVRLVLDGDLKLRNLAKELINTDRLVLLWDLAHLKRGAVKVIAGLIKDCGFKGDSTDRIGKKNFLALTRAVKTAMAKAAKAVREDKATAEQVIEIMNVPINHFAGKFFSL